MELILIAVWLFVGLIGCILGTLSDLSNGNDFKVSDCFVCLLAMGFGPVIFVLGLCAYCSTDSNKFNKSLIKGNK